jgi:acyl-CoA synthetase (AMP-forming)/AMP-acid ligase II
VSAGHLLPGFEARTTREDGSRCDDGELGEIELRGGTMVGEYFEEPGIRFNNPDGYFQTGDLGYIVRGELLIAGRTGDRIKVNAQSLFSSDFEFAVQSLPFVKPGRTAVFQIDDRIIVLAELSDKKTLTAAEAYREAVRNVIVARLGVKLPTDNILFIAPGQIKKTTSGKINRRAMAETFLKGLIRPARLETAPARDARGAVAASHPAVEAQHSSPS